jgi:hypothetical protein
MLHSTEGELFAKAAENSRSDDVRLMQSFLVGNKDGN